MKIDSVAYRFAAWLVGTFKAGSLVQLILPSQRFVPAPIARRTPVLVQRRKRF
jgi:hypothetical protein